MNSSNNPKFFTVRSLWQLVLYGGTIVLFVSLFATVIWAQDINVDVGDLNDLDSRDLQQLRNIHLDGFRDIEIDFRSSGFQSDSETAFAVVRMMEIFCPTCSTTSSGSTVRVSFSTGRTSSSNNQTTLERGDDSDAEEVANRCRYLVDRYGGDNDIVIQDEYEEETLAICFDN